MKKIVSSVLFVLLCSFYSYAQDSNAVAPQPDSASATPQTDAATSESPKPEPAKWKKSGVLMLSYNQTAPSDNWAGTESYSRSWSARLDLSAERTASNTNWLTTFKEYYGETESKDTHAVSLDMIEFNTVWVYRIYRYLQPYGSFYVLSQNNRFWDPVTYMESAGLNFTIMENAVNTLKVRAGGALRQVDDSINGNKRESGAEGVMNYSLLFHKSARFVSEARVFESFENGEDLRWDNRLFLKTGPWFTTEFGYTVFFDRSRIPAHSWPHDVETLLYAGIGFSFNVFQ